MFFIRRGGDLDASDVQAFQEPEDLFHLRNASRFNGDSHHGLLGLFVFYFSKARRRIIKIGRYISDEAFGEAKPPERPVSFGSCCLFAQQGLNPGKQFFILKGQDHLNKLQFFGLLGHALDDG
jgi:hypothetical protein